MTYVTHEELKRKFEELDDLQRDIHKLHQQIDKLETAVVSLINLVLGDPPPLRVPDLSSATFSSKSNESRQKKAAELIQEFGGAQKVIEAFLNNRQKTP